MSFALDQHKTRTGRKPVLPRVVGQRHPRVCPDAIELSSEPERGREPHRSGLPVAQPDRRDCRDNCASCRRQVRERRGQVAADDRVVGV